MMTLNDVDAPRLTREVSEMAAEFMGCARNMSRRPSILWFMTAAEAYLAYREELGK